MAVIGLPGPGITPPRAGAPPLPSAALQRWVAAHYAPPLRAGELMRLARNPARAAQLVHPALSAPEAASRIALALHNRTADISAAARTVAGLPTAPAPASTVAGPAAPVDPYAAYPDYVRASLQQMDADKAAAQQNAVTTQAWLAPALQALQQGQQQAQGAYGTTLAGLYQNLGAQGPAQVSATSPGGVVSGPVNASLQAQQQASPLSAAAQQQMGAVHSLLGNLKVGDLGAGALGNLAYQAGQIPNVFAANKAKYLQGVDQALAQAQAQAQADAAKLAEQQREFGITSGNVSAGQQLNYALGLAKLAAGGGTTAAGGLKPSSSALPLAPGQTPPAGYQSYTDPSGQTFAIKAPKSPAQSTGSGGMFIPGAQNAQLVKQGYTAVRVPGGFRYVKPGGGTTGSTSKGYQTLIANWSKEANKRLQGKRTQTGTVSTVNAQGATVTTPRYAVQGRQDPESVFASMLAAGVRPHDAYRLVNANAPKGVSLDAIDVYNALSTSNLTEKQARSLAFKLTGDDPVVMAAGNYP